MSKPVLGPHAGQKEFVYPPPPAGHPPAGNGPPSITRASKPVLQRDPNKRLDLDAMAAEPQAPSRPTGDFAALLGDKLALDDLDPGTSAVQKLRQAEAQNVQAMASLDKQGRALDSVGYRLEDMDRTLEQGDHYLESCDGYLGAFKTTALGPKLRGKRLNDGPVFGENGEEVVGEDGQPLPYGGNAIEGHGPDMAAPAPADSSRYAQMGSLQVRSSSQSMKEDYEQQEKALDEVNAILGNITEMTSVMGRELEKQDRQMEAVTQKQTDTSYNVERTNHKLKKLC